MPSIVKVHIHRARGLPVMDRASSSADAYVALRFGQDEKFTRVCKKSLDPVWDFRTRFEVDDDDDLIQEPLVLQVMDKDTITSDDAIGFVLIALELLLTRARDSGEQLLEGWFPIYDTLEGIRGKILVSIRVQSFGDTTSKGTEAHTAVSFHASSSLDSELFPRQWIMGFVEELLVEDDPEFDWSESFRSSRKSNQARQLLLHRMSHALRARIAKKTIDIGGNSVVGYRQHFDFEGDSGIVARAYGTAAYILSPAECGMQYRLTNEVDTQSSMPSTELKPDVMHQSKPKNATFLHPYAAATAACVELHHMQQNPVEGIGSPPPTLDESPTFVTLRNTIFNATPNIMTLMSSPYNAIHRSKDLFGDIVNVALNKKDCLLSKQYELVMQRNNALQNHMRNARGYIVNSDLAESHYEIDRHNKLYQHHSTINSENQIIPMFSGKLRLPTTTMKSAFSTKTPADNTLLKRFKFLLDPFAYEAITVPGNDQLRTRCGIYSDLGLSFEIMNWSFALSNGENPLNNNVRHTANVGAERVIVRDIDKVNDQAHKHNYRASVSRSGDVQLFSISSIPMMSRCNFGGLVAARSIKFLGRLHAKTFDQDRRDQWWTELREEIKSHAARLRCDQIIGYKEDVTIFGDVAILTVYGTAVRLRNLGRRVMKVSKMEHRLRRQQIISSAVQKSSNNQTSAMYTEGFSTATKYRPLLTTSSACQGLHLPFHHRHAIFHNVRVVRCSSCKRGWVPEFLLSTIELPPQIPVTGPGCLIAARAVRIRDKASGEADCEIISKELLFLEYEVHQQLMLKLRIASRNAAFCLQYRLSIGRTHIILMATATAIYVDALPAPAPLVIHRTNGLSAKAVEIDLTAATLYQRATILQEAHFKDSLLASALYADSEAAFSASRACHNAEDNFFIPKWLYGDWTREGSDDDDMSSSSSSSSSTSDSDEDSSISDIDTESDDDVSSLSEGEVTVQGISKRKHYVFAIEDDQDEALIKCALDPIQPIYQTTLTTATNIDSNRFCLAGHHIGKIKPPNPEESSLESQMHVGPFARYLNESKAHKRLVNLGFVTTTFGAQTGTLRTECSLNGPMQCYGVRHMSRFRWDDIFDQLHTIKTKDDATILLRRTRDVHSHIEEALNSITSLSSSHYFASSIKRSLGFNKIRKQAETNSKANLPHSSDSNSSSPTNDLGETAFTSSEALNLMFEKGLDELRRKAYAKGPCEIIGLRFAINIVDVRSVELHLYGTAVKNPKVQVVPDPGKTRCIRSEILAPWNPVYALSETVISAFQDLQRTYGSRLLTDSAKFARSQHIAEMIHKNNQYIVDNAMKVCQQEPIKALANETVCENAADQVIFCTSDEVGSMKIVKYLGRVNLHFVRESIAVKPTEESLAAFDTAALDDAHAAVEAYVRSMKGNALLWYRIDCYSNPSTVPRNSVYRVVSISGDIVFVSGAKS